MKRKFAVVAAVIVVASVTGWLTLRGPYHQWRWAACREAAERLRNGTNTRSDEFFSLIRGRPMTYTDHYEAATGHEDALIRLNHLARKEFRLRNPLTSNSAMDQFSAAATKRFPKTREWSCVFSAMGDSLVITTVIKRMQEWEKFIREYDSAGTSTFRGCAWRSGSMDGMVFNAKTRSRKEGIQTADSRNFFTGANGDNREFPFRFLCFLCFLL